MSNPIAPAGGALTRESPRDGGPAVPVPARRAPLYSDELIRALGVAATLHAGQIRKGTDKVYPPGVPYLAHLLGTCSIVLEHGGTETEAIAALLHDTIEDVPPEADTRARVRTFGEDVYAIVDGCTDGVANAEGRKADWYPRKQAYLDHLATADASMLLVSAAVKLHNARAIVADQRASGDAVFANFKKGKGGTCWYYRSLVGRFRANPAHNARLVGELERVVREMHELAGTPWPNEIVRWTPDGSAA